MAEMKNKNLISRKLSMSYMKSIEEKLERQVDYNNAIPYCFMKCLKVSMEVYTELRTGKKILNRKQINLLEKKFDLSIDAALNQKFTDKGLVVTHPQFIAIFNNTSARFDKIQKLFSKLLGLHKKRGHVGKTQKPEKNDCQPVTRWLL